MSLISIAVLGTAIVIVLMSVPAVRNVITYKETSCTILNKTLEPKMFGKVLEMRPLFNVRLFLGSLGAAYTPFSRFCPGSQSNNATMQVSFVPRYDSMETNVSCAFRSPVFNQYYIVNQSSWMSQYEVRC